jgi:hypothetical protein
MVAREILLRASPLKRGGWLFFLVCCVVLAVSACYEFIEWWTALIGGGSAEAFLGMQGDVWDTQWDMFLALCGAVAAQLTLSRLHDRALARLVDGRVESAVGSVAQADHRVARRPVGASYIVLRSFLVPSSGRSSYVRNPALVRAVAQAAAAGDAVG